MFLLTFDVLLQISRSMNTSNLCGLLQSLQTSGIVSGDFASKFLKIIRVLPVIIQFPCHIRFRCNLQFYMEFNIKFLNILKILDMTSCSIKCSVIIDISVIQSEYDSFLLLKTNVNIFETDQIWYTQQNM